MSCQNDLETQEGTKEYKNKKKFLGGACPQTPLEACAFGAHLGNRSVFILDLLLITYSLLFLPFVPCMLNV